MLASIVNGKVTLKNPTEIIKNLDPSFEMKLDYTPKSEHDIIKLKGSRILTNGNFMLFISRAGSGKSNVMEALAANAINPDCDAFGFEVDIGDEKVCLIDTERSLNNFNDGYKRIQKRAGIHQNHSEIDEANQRLKRCQLYSYKSITDFKILLKTFKHHASQGYKLILADQIADFILNVNDIEQSHMLLMELEGICLKYDCGIVLTIHPNPKDADLKATGHLGSFLQKKSESTLAIIPADDETRVITSKFGHGKLRNSMHVETAFMWDSDSRMFIGTELLPKIKEKVNQANLEMDSIIEELFSEKMFVSKEEMLIFVQERKKDPKLKFTYIEEYNNKRNAFFLIDGYYQRNNKDKYDDVPF